MDFDYIQTVYKVPAELGRRVTCYGKPGTIVKSFGHYIGVVIDGDASETPARYHPTDGVTYGDMTLSSTPALKTWNCLPPWCDEFEDDAWFIVLASTRSKARYKAFRYLTHECELDLDRRALLSIMVKSA